MAEDEDANIISRVEKKKADPEKEGVNSYSKYAVGGEPKEVPAASVGLDENDNFIHRREQNQPKRKKGTKKK